MDAGTAAFLGVLIGGLITGVVTIGAELIRGRREAGLDSAKRSDDRRLGRDAFQRAQLLELQEAAEQLLNATEAIHFHAQASGTMFGLPSALENSYDEAVLRVSKLRSRIADARTREHAEVLLGAATATLKAPDRETGNATRQALRDARGQLLTRTGELIVATFVDPTKDT